MTQPNPFSAEELTERAMRAALDPRSGVPSQVLYYATVRQYMHALSKREKLTTHQSLHLAHANNVIYVWYVETFLPRAWAEIGRKAAP